MSAEQTHHRLGVAEEVTREMQDQLQRVAGHLAAHEALHTVHQEMNLLRSQIERRSIIRLAEPKSLMPDRFGKRSGPKLVVLGKGLRWSGAFSTATGDEKCRKQEAADLRVEPPGH